MCVFFHTVIAAEFRSYFEHVKSLRFDDRPDYDYLKRLFRELFFRKGALYCVVCRLLFFEEKSTCVLVGMLLTLSFWFLVIFTPDSLVLLISAGYTYDNMFDWEVQAIHKVRTCAV